MDKYEFLKIFENHSKKVGDAIPYLNDPTPKTSGKNPL